jgi:nitrate reductase NapAB chaperone NapD
MQVRRHRKHGDEYEREALVGIVRNFIDIIGITPEGELPHMNRGEIIEYSDHENIFIPDTGIAIESIYQIVIVWKIKSHRMLNTPLGKINILDGVKELKIVYTDMKQEGEARILTVERPFNTFIDLPHNADIENTEVFIADAYFQLLDERNIYGHYLYVIDVQYRNEPPSIPHVKISNEKRSNSLLSNTVISNAIQSNAMQSKVLQTNVKLSHEQDVNTEWIAGSDISLESEFL